MTLIDANLLIYAFRAELPHHAVVNAWLRHEIQTGTEFFLHPVAVAAFLRLTTKVLGPLPAAPMSAAMNFLAALHPIVPALLPEDAAHLEIARRLAERHRIAGDGCNDLWLAAFAIRHHLILASADTGFARFQPELNWFNPLPTPA
jgi:toxin-antitoxin system PIN domain toxin